MRLLIPIVVFVILLSGVRHGSSVSATDSLGRVNFITKLPLVLFFFYSESNGAGVWIPEEPAKDIDGSVKDEYAEVATVFAKPEAKVVQPEVVPSEQPVPWTTLKQEWDLYKKFHAEKKNDDDSSEDSAEEEDEEEDDELPQAFYGQQNGDDDEREFFHKEKDIYKKSKKTVGKVKDSSEEDDGPNDDLNLDKIPDNVKQAMIQELISSRNPGGQGGQDEPPQGGPPQGGPPPPEQESEENDDPEEDQPQSDIAGSAESSEVKKKGEDAPIQDDDGGHGNGKGKKKKKKKGKKGKGGWGWKKPLYIPIPPPKHHGWKDHDGFLEQLVKGSTWERVLAYYHQRKDEQEQNKGWGWGWEEEKPDLETTVHQTGEKLVNKLFKGSFWERAFRTYANYQKNKPSLPSKEFNNVPLSIDW